MSLRRLSRLALLALGAPLVGCDSLPPEPCPAAGLGMEAPSLDSLTVGRRVSLQARPNLCINPEAVVEWEVSDSTAARVASAGRHGGTLVALAPGEGTLYVWERGTPPASGYATRYRVVESRLPAPERDTAALFQTDSLHYTLRAADTRWEARIQVLLTNSRPDTIIISNCVLHTKIVLQKRVAEEWRTVWSPAVPMCFFPIIRVPPGGTYRWDVPLNIGHMGDAADPWTFEADDVPGEYRLRWPWVDTNNVNGRFPDAHRVSNRFSLTVARR